MPLTEQEKADWTNFNDACKLALEIGSIRMADYVFLAQLPDLKTAHQMLQHRIRKCQREDTQMAHAQLRAVIEQQYAPFKPKTLWQRLVAVFHQLK